MRPVIVDSGPPDSDRRPAAGPLPMPGRPAGSSAPVIWVDRGARLAITTWDSSSNPMVPTALEVTGRVLVLTMGRRNPDATVVTADLAAYVTVIETPAGLDPRRPVTVRIGDREYELAPAATADER